MEIYTAPTETKPEVHRWEWPAAAAFAMAMWSLQVWRAIKWWTRKLL